MLVNFNHQAQRLLPLWHAALASKQAIFNLQLSRLCCPCKHIVSSSLPIWAGSMLNHACITSAWSLSTSTARQSFRKKRCVNFVCAEAEVGGGDAWRIYDYVSRHFLGSLSADAVSKRTSVVFSAGGESFHAEGVTPMKAGFTAIMPWKVCLSGSHL